jgi:cytochrome c oxidase subunit 4
LTIGTFKASLLAAIFMKLRHRIGLTLVFAGAGLFRQGILLRLGGILDADVRLSSS